MKGEIELYNISFLILKVNLHFNKCFLWKLKIGILVTPSHVTPSHKKQFFLIFLI